MTDSFTSPPNDAVQALPHFSGGAEWALTNNKHNTKTVHVPSMYTPSHITKRDKKQKRLAHVQYMCSHNKQKKRVALKVHKNT